MPTKITNSISPLPPTFSGQYYDEFCCVGFLGSPKEKEISVLMLGLGDGKGVVPILISPRVSHLHIVDFDESLIQAFHETHRELSNDPRIKITLNDAEEFLANSQHTYDVIIADLYTQTEYSHLMLDAAFHKALINSLHPSGHLLINSFGVPMNLAPFSGASPQRWLAQSLQKTWRTIRYLPHRRNATIILGPSLFNLSNGLDSSSFTSPHDTLFISLMKVRLEHLNAVPCDLAGVAVPRMDFAGIDLEMQGRWLKLLPCLSRWLPQKLQLTNISDLRTLLSQPDACTKLQSQLMSTSETFRWTLPLLLAGEAASAHLHAAWFAEWVISELEKSHSIDIPLWLEALVPQAHALLVAEQHTQGITMRFTQALKASHILPAS